IAKLLIDSGANVNAKGRLNRTPLFLAVCNGHTEIVKALIDAGVDVDAQDGFNWTALMYVAREGNSDIAKLLIDSGANVNAKGRLNRTPLFLAVCNGHTEIVKALIDAGADVTVEDNSGITDLDIAVEKQLKEITLELLPHVLADIYVREGKKAATDKLEEVKGRVEITEEKLIEKLHNVCKPILQLKAKKVILDQLRNKGDVKKLSLPKSLEEFLTEWPLLSMERALAIENLLNHFSQQLSTEVENPSADNIGSQNVGLPD
ncbi:MAG: ankyrin repeat domain-containing protein, partial [Rickettsiaceae bacterium H1]|nr:ankyrin repeat domain-containing protein [Rickettsiaceae bacterium H1]